jgi:hypothetical protein
MKYVLPAALTASLLVVQAASAQERTLQLDVNNLSIQARDSLGAPVPFSGLNHTGSLQMMFQPAQTELLGVLMQTGSGPFILQTGFTGSLTAASVQINLNSGSVTGGNMLFDINGGPGSGGDRYTASIAAGGNVAPFIQGGFQIEGLTSSGMFSDDNFAGVNIADFFANQGGQFLPGYYFAFRIQPTPTGSGSADMDVFVTNIPAPGSMLCLAAAGLFASRRRR